MIPDGLIRTPMGLYVLREDTHLSRWVENSRRLDIEYDVNEIASLAHLIPEGGVVIDAGACLGDHTVIYSQIVGASGHVYAFEPHPLACAALRLNMARLSNVTVVNAALSDRTGAARLMRDPNAGASFVADNGTVRIETARLDDLLFPQLTRCDLVHLDAEGLEPQILAGAQALLARFSPVLIIEVCDHHLRRAGSSEALLLTQVAALGYEVRPIAGQDDAAQRDVLAVRRGAA
jgi:FkbM family methyltransferase